MPGLLELFVPREKHWEAAGLVAFRSLLLLHAAVRASAWFPSGLLDDYASLALIIGMRAMLVVAAIASLWPRLGRAAAGLATAVVLCQVILGFPEIADHVYLELSGLVLFALFDPRNAVDGPLLRGTLSWMGAIVLFHSGLQKLLHGYYFFAEFPLWAIATDDPVGRLYAWLIPAAEVARVRGLNLFLPESGPFRSQAVPLIFMSNAVWAVEIELAVMMCIRSTRRFAAIAAIVAVVIVQLVGNLPLAALLLSQFLLLSVPGQWNRRLAFVFVAAYVAVLLARFGVLPLALRETAL